MRIHHAALLTLATSVLWAPALAAQQFEKVPEAQPAQQSAAAEGVKIGIINIQVAMARTQEGKKAAEDLQAQFGPRQADLQKLQDDIRNLESQLRAQERTLSDEARAQLARQIEQKRKELTRTQQDLQDDAQDAQNDHINRIGEKMQRIIDRYAREKNLSVVLNAVYWFQGGAFVYAAPATDITDDIVRLYDQTYPVQAAAPPSPPPAQPPASRPNPPKKQN